VFVLTSQAREPWARPVASIGRDARVELVETVASPRVTHVRYAVNKR
jgi:hypothetical protein